MGDRLTLVVVASASADLSIKQEVFIEVVEAHVNPFSDLANQNKPQLPNGNGTGGVQLARPNQVR